MKKNIGDSDRLIRLLVAAIFVMLWFQNIATGIIGIILLIMAGSLVLTGLLGLCLAYKLFGISTCVLDEDVMHLPDETQELKSTEVSQNLQSL